jgi:hypothetical protein
MTLSSTDADIDSSSNGLLVGISALSSVSVSVYPQAASSTSVTASVTFTPSNIVNVGQVYISLPGYANVAAGVLTIGSSSNCTFTAPVLTILNNVLLITKLNITAANIAAGPCSFTVVGLTNPAAQPAFSNLVVKTQTSSLPPADIDSSLGSGYLVAINALSSVSVSVYPQAAFSTSVTASVTFIPSNIVNAGQVFISLPGYANVTAGVLTIGSSSN